MRLAFALLALAVVPLVPGASASVELPVSELPVFVRVQHDETLPTEEDGCDSCFDVAVGVGVGMSGCCDLPAFGVGIEVDGGDGTQDGRLRVCYTSFIYTCFVDLPFSI